MPAFIGTDAAILAAVTEHWPSWRSKRLAAFVHDYDWLNREIPSYESVSPGLARLVAGGYVIVRKSARRGITLAATGTARQLGKEARRRARSLGEVTPAFEMLLSRAHSPDVELKTRPPARLRGFEREDWDEAVRAYERWMERWSKPWIALSELAHRVLMRLRPEDYR